MKAERTRLIRRGGGQRDARLFVIAAEGSVTEKQYFEGLREHQVIDPRRVRIEVIDAENGTRSAPQHVLARLDELRQRFQLSNPCFELWLLLHFTDDVSEIRVDEEPRASCGRCEQRLRQICGSYDKSKLQVERYTRERVGAAIDRARALDASPDDRWPQSAGTHVYRLAHELLQQSRRNAFPPHGPE